MRHFETMGKLGCLHRAPLAVTAILMMQALFLSLNTGIVQAQDIVTANASSVVSRPYTPLIDTDTDSQPGQEVLETFIASDASSSEDSASRESTAESTQSPSVVMPTTTTNTSIHSDDQEEQIVLDEEDLSDTSSYADDQMGSDTNMIEAKQEPLRADANAALAGSKSVRPSEPDDPTVTDEQANFGASELRIHREFRDETISFEDFEHGNDHSWTDQRVAQSEFFTSFLGRFGQEEDGNDAFTQTSKAYHVPPEAGSVEITFDFFEIDLWCHCDHLTIMICNQTVDMGTFSQSGADNQSGVTPADIEWWRRAQTRNDDLGYSRYRDGVHQMGLIIPQDCYAPKGGLLELKFNLTIDGYYQLASAGKRYRMYSSSCFTCYSPAES
jgi:hypothetical protein